MPGVGIRVVWVVVMRRIVDTVVVRFVKSVTEVRLVRLMVGVIVGTEMMLVAGAGVGGARKRATRTTTMMAIPSRAGTRSHRRLKRRLPFANEYRQA
jgi:hypothetical protein